MCSADRKNECKQIYNFDLQRFRNAHHFRRKKSRQRLVAVLKAKRQQRNWCVDCSDFFLEDEEFRHQEHLVKRNISKRQIRRPTELISAIVDKNEEAQYFFTKESMRVVMQTIRRAGFTDVLCIGCPSVHQHLRVHQRQYDGIRSMLLDIDKRYLQFFPASQFLCFNMVNGFCFETPESEQHLDNFLKNSHRLLILIDPPFGALIPALGETIRKLQKRLAYLKREPTTDDQQKITVSDETIETPQETQGQLAVQSAKPSSTSNLMIFHLYFFEKHIVSEFPGVKMMDFQLSYANHAKMNQQEKSIARIFTDLKGRLVKLPKQLGYKFCVHCQRYVSKVAEHCFECKNCGAKDGKPSVHCAVCDKCVKNTWTHCFVCELCTLPGKCKCGDKNRNSFHVDSDGERTRPEGREDEREGQEEKRSFKSGFEGKGYGQKRDFGGRQESFNRKPQFKSNPLASKRNFWDDKIRQDQEFGDGVQRRRHFEGSFKREYPPRDGFRRDGPNNFRRENNWKPRNDRFEEGRFNRFPSEHRFEQRPEYRSENRSKHRSERQYEHREPGLDTRSHQNGSSKNGRPFDRQMT